MPGHSVKVYDEPSRVGQRARRALPIGPGPSCERVRRYGGTSSSYVANLIPALQWTGHCGHWPFASWTPSCRIAVPFVETRLMRMPPTCTRANR
jgi:hypothetical protein